MEDSLAYSIPGAKLKALEGKIHLPWYEKTEAIIKEILSFLGMEWQLLLKVIL